MNTLPRAGLAAIDGARARPLPWHPVLRTQYLPPVRSLLATDRTLYVGGAFFSVDGSRRRGLAAFELPSLQLDPWQPRLDGDPWSDAKALALVGDTLSVGGTFKALNGRSRQAIVTEKTNRRRVEPSANGGNFRVTLNDPSPATRPPSVLPTTATIEAAGWRRWPRARRAGPRLWDNSRDPWPLPRALPESAVASDAWARPARD